MNGKSALAHGTGTLAAHSALGTSTRHTALTPTVFVTSRLDARTCKTVRTAVSLPHEALLALHFQKLLVNAHRYALLVVALRRPAAATGDVRAMRREAARVDLAISIRIIDNMSSG